jgi:hypothetical protein
VAEHFLGKEEVKSSILFNGSFRKEWLNGKKKSRFKENRINYLKTQLKPDTNVKRDLQKG